MIDLTLRIHLPHFPNLEEISFQDLSSAFPIRTNFPLRACHEDFPNLTLTPIHEDRTPRTNLSLLSKKYQRKIHPIHPMLSDKE